MIATNRASSAAAAEPYAAITISVDDPVTL